MNVTYLGCIHLTKPFRPLVRLDLTLRSERSSVHPVVPGPYTEYLKTTGTRTHLLTKLSFPMEGYLPLHIFLRSMTRSMVRNYGLFH